MPEVTARDRDPDTLPYEGWPEAHNGYGTRPGDDRPVLVRIRLYRSSDESDTVESIAISTVNDGPILLGRVFEMPTSDPPVMAPPRPPRFRARPQTNPHLRAGARQCVRAAVAVREWTGREVRLLRQARRMTVREFGKHLGVSPRMVSKWEAADHIRPRPVNQAALDTSLAHADPYTQQRFVLLIGADAGRPADAPNPLL